MTIDTTRRQISKFGLTGTAVALSACTLGSGPNHIGADAPRFEAIAKQRLGGSPWALVLGSGGPRGFVHIGVLLALDQMGLRPNLVVGASIGAFVASLYCSGLGAKALRKLAMDIGPTDMARLAIGANERYSGAPIASQINRLLGGRRLQELSPVCAVVATDQETAQAIAFTAGDSGVAVQASTAITGQFTPVKIRGRDYVDPDSQSPLPVRIARALGADRVLSVDASAHEDRAPAGANRFRQSDLEKRRVTAPDAAAADINLHPDFGYWVSTSDEFKNRAIEAGYRDTLAQASNIRQLAKQAKKTA